jgi:hypothetical protein
MANDLIVVSKEELYMLLGQYALPKGDEDCAPYAQELVRRVEDMTIPHLAVIY